MFKYKYNFDHWLDLETIIFLFLQFLKSLFLNCDECFFLFTLEFC